MRLKEYFKDSLITCIVSIVCLLMFIIVNIYPNLSSTNAAILFGAYYKAFVVAGEYWRLLTCGFIHVSLMHFLVNMLSFLNIGRFMERQVGRKKYLLILICSIIGGSIFQYIIKGNSVAVGLSGGLYGLVAAYTYLLVRLGALKNPVVRGSLIRMYLINLYINFIPGVAYSAHLGGFLFGLFLMAILDETIQKDLRTHFIIGLIIISGFISYLFVNASYILSNEKYIKTDYDILSEEMRLGLDGYALNMANKLDDIYQSDNVLYDSLIILKEE